MTLQINMVRDYSENPYGRTHAQGKANAEDFRTGKLIPALNAGGAVVVDLTGISGMSASYVQEAFGKLINDFELADLEARLRIVATDDRSLVAMAWQEIREAAADKRRLAH